MQDWKKNVFNWKFSPRKKNKNRNKNKATTTIKHCSSKQRFYKGFICLTCTTTGNKLSRGLPGSTVVKNLPANIGDTRDAGLIPGSGRYPGVRNGKPLQCILARKIPWTEWPGGLQSMRSQRIRHDWASMHAKVNIFIYF